MDAGDHRSASRTPFPSPVARARRRRAFAGTHARPGAAITAGWRDDAAGPSHNPALGVRPPKSRKALPQALSPDEAARLLAVSSDVPVAADEVRDQAMFELFYSSGLRLAGLVALDCAAFGQITGGEVRVLGKRT